MKSKHCILIPVYKDGIFEEEKIDSINNCLTKMSKWDIYFMCPESVNKEFYINTFIKKYNRDNIFISYFNDMYFKDIKGYDLMCLHYSTYERFLDYEYMLIAQPDTWIFDDKLEYFCNKGYDCLGALILHYEKSIKIADVKNAVHCLNGGFSLRNIKNFYNITKIKNYDIIKNYTFIRHPDDGFICEYLKDYLNIPIYENLDLNTIFEFSGETRCDEIYPELCNKIPFGCHTFSAKKLISKTFNIENENY